MHQEKQAYKQKVDAQLREWDAKAELLKAKGNNLAADAKVEFEEQLENFEENKAEFTAYLDELADRADDKWDDMKDEAESKWKSFTNSVESFVSKHT
jgi:hypothetical protein